MICPSCRTDQDADAKHCDQCRHRFEAEARPADWAAVSVMALRGGGKVLKVAAYCFMAFGAVIALCYAAELPAATLTNVLLVIILAAIIRK